MEYKKKPKLNTKIGKYYMAVKKGTPKTEAQKKAGFGNGHNSTQIENSKTYKALEKKFKDYLLEEITMEEITKALADNIRQGKDKGARNVAVKMAKETIEPQGDIEIDEGEVKVVISKR